MKLHNKLTELLNLSLPIVQAPMGGGIAGPRLAAAVSNAGGLGLLPIWPMPPEQADRQLKELRTATSGVFGVNLNVAFGPQAHLDLALDLSVPVIHFFWGDCSAFVAGAKSRGAIVMTTVANAAEARRARDAGVDILVAQGLEAGGHVWGKIGLAALVPIVVDAGGGLPVVAAGGIADGRGLASALMLGASAAMVGTALLVADECGAHPKYKEAILNAGEGDTVHGNVFDAGWPGAPCRVLRNSTLRAWEEAGSPPSGKRPGENDIVAYGASRAPIPRYSVQPPSTDVEGDVEAMALYAGQGVGLVTATAPAATIISKIVQDAVLLLGNEK
ncbi:MAG TPA: nitronate monooxygenase [Rhizomicrobium sp.]|jgi:NAD(P)H-dependent flavin oxidoreductase YrpB (nitropropane dioxygenase family)